MAIKLSQLLSVLPTNLNISKTYPDIEINQIRLDSREITTGDLFFAYKGTSLDSREYIAQVVQRGAGVVLFDGLDFKPSQEISSIMRNNDVLFIDIPNLIKYISLLAGEFYGNPSHHMHVYAITGTNGKTTCNYLLAQIINYLSHVKVGLIGTTGYGEISDIINNKNSLNKLTNTTPGPILLQKLLSKLQSISCHNVCLEASSHALDQYRLSGINIKTAIFTNISHDHLDYHHTLEDYYLAKKKLFLFETIQNIVINIDDTYGERLLNELIQSNLIHEKKIFIYGFSQEKLEKYNLPYVFYVNNKLIYWCLEGSYEYNYNSSLIGNFNIYNNLAVIAAMLANNYSFVEIMTRLPELKPAPGRMEVFHCHHKNVDLIVDYAHTPDALEKALKALNNSKTETSNNIWCVFGCGGNRDKDKRPKMGNIAAVHSDRLIITDDNPRTESAENIINDIKNGIRPEYEHKVFAIINNRREAIKLALENSVAGDKILIAGKGHEDYQICGTESFPYNEREYVAQLIL